MSLRTHFRQIHEPSGEKNHPCCCSLDEYPQVVENAHILAQFPLAKNNARKIEKMSCNGILLAIERYIFSGCHLARVIAVAQNKA